MLRTRAVVAAMCFLTAGSPAFADGPVHVTAPVYGCQKPRAAKAINDLNDPRHSNPRWIAYVMGDGQCVKITPQSPWSAIGGDSDGLTLLSYNGTIGKPGSFYVPSASIAFASADAQPAPPTAPLSPPAAIETVPGASPKAPAPSPVSEPPGQSPDSAQDGSTPSPNAAPADQQAAPAPAAGPPSASGDGAPGAAPTPAPQTIFPAPPPLDDQKLAELRSQVDEAGKGGVGGGGFLILCLIFIVVAGGIIATVVSSRRAKAAAEKRLWMLVESEIAHNTRPLRVKRLHTVQRDEFGTIKWDKWLAAIEYYYSSRILPILSAEGFQTPPFGFTEEAHRMIEAAATSQLAAGEAVDELPAQYASSPDVFDTRMHPIDYEGFCAIQLQKAGWDTRTTVATGDQGADVIATQAGKMLVIQCKLYSGSIGNDAVQQVLSARTYQSAQFAAVVSNQPFTRSARQLASVSGVVLLHHDELQTLRLPDLQRRKATA